MLRKDKLKIVEELITHSAPVLHKHFYYDEAMFNEKDNSQIRKSLYTVINLLASHYKR